MAPLDRLWNSRPPTHDLAPALGSALADLKRLAAERPEIAAAAAGLAPVLRAAFQRPVPTPQLHVQPDLIQAAWRAGVPAWSAGESSPALDPEDLRSRARTVCDALGSQHESARTLRHAVRARTVDLAEWSREALSGRPEAVDAQAARVGVRPDLARSVLRLTLLPALAGLSGLLSELRQGGDWSGGRCPNCGSDPCLMESRGLEQRRFGRCGLCAADWRGDRLRCPYCDETDHRKLHYRFVEGEEERYRLALCDSCGGSVRLVSTLASLSAPGLLVAELATAHLDALL